MPNKEKSSSDIISENIKEKSFKVKPLLLELPNYEYLHSATKGSDEDRKERFVGRKNIINKILSFIHESSKNTGTYLVTGYRGMGKTSVVNKALSTLNPKSDVGIYIMLWILMLPWIIFSNDLKTSLKDLNLLKISTYSIIITLLTTFTLLGSHNWGRKKLNCNWFVFNINRIKRGFESFLNPSYRRSKHSFPANFRKLSIYTCMVFIFLIIIHCSNYNPTIEKNILFWKLTMILFYHYFFVKIYLRIVLRQRFIKTKNDWIIYIVKIILIVIYLISLYIILFKDNFNKLFIDFFNVSHETSVFIFIGFISFIYFVICYILPKNDKTKASIYETTFNSLTGYFNFNHFLSIKVNLGKDILTEKDVLKYIVNELYKDYSKWHKNYKNFKRLINKVGILLFLYLSVSLFCNNFLGSEFSRFNSSTMSVPVYFPSQALLSIESESSLKSIVNPDDKNILFKNNSLDLYIESIHILLIEEDSIKKKSLKEEPFKINLLKDSFKIKIGYENSDLHEKIKKANSFKIIDTVYFGNEEVPVKNKDSIIYNILFKHGEVTNKLIQTQEQKESSLIESIHYSLMKICNEIDYLFLKMWIGTRRIIISDTLGNNTLAEFIFPVVPNIFVFALLFIALILYKFTTKKIFFVNTHNHILKDLRYLKKQIDASITFEENTNTASLKTSWFNLRRSVSYQPLEAKDITQRLIHILEKADTIPFIFTKVKFIFIFDELDKIMPHDSLILSTKEDEFEAKNNEVRYHARRKERVALILASMKYFLNSAKAKFIFIAGRDMYDAALSGISDRESSLDSIFNDNKIYVNSFYTEGEDGNKSDITSITEQYVCQLLIPDWFFSKNKETPLGLNLYNQYLIYFFKEETKVKESKRIREKIIITLKDYIVYLSYRSNGAPRKLSNLLERNVRPVILKELKDTKSITIGRNNDNLYLNIGYYDQYKVSLISSLTTPVFLSIGNFLHEYSDKLLVSISYMLDHLYKFHKFGLSYRNLSLTPEIVDVNKEPQFREFLDKLLHSLSKNHLRPIVSGIYDYRFHSKISSEIKFLSKIDDLEGAALNFTLDESIELKRYFNKRLQQLKESNGNIILEKEKSEHVNNLGLLHMTIGDLHFYDEEYQEAISHYLDAIQNLRQKNIKKMVLYEFVLFVRNKLKLALAFEKNKMFDNALMTYSEITDLIVRKRNIPMRKFGLVRFVISRLDFENLINGINTNNISNLEALIQHLHNQWSSNPNLRDVTVLGRLNDTKKDFNDVELTNKNYLYPLEKMAVFYSGSSDNMITNLEEIEINHKSLKYNYLQSTGENIRILYQASLAKLHLIEKSSPDKLKDIDIIRAINEFKFIRLPLKNKEKRVIVSEFYNKLGDLLYFKNGTMNKCLKKKFLIKINNLISNKQNENQTSITNKIEETNSYKNLLTSPIDALIFYTKSLAILLIPKQKVCPEDEKNGPEKIDIIKYYDGLSNNNSSESFLVFFKNIKNTIDSINSKILTITNEFLVSYKERYSYEYLSSVANGITDLAETLISFTKEGYTNKHTSNEKILFFTNTYSLSFILELHYKSFEIYKGIGAHRLAKSQLLKVLHIAKESKLKVNEIEFLEKNTPEKISNEAIKCVYNTYDYSHFIENKKIEEIFSVGENNDKINHIKANINSEINEIILLKWNIKLDRLIKDKNLNELLDFYNIIQKNINPYSIIKRKFGRIYQLALKLRINYELYKRPECELNEVFTNNMINGMKVKEFKVFLVLDSIGANNELLKSHYLFGIDYVTTNHVQLAKAHSSMAFWCQEFNKLKNENDYDKYKKILKNIVLNTKTLMNLSSTYHNNKSLEFNYAAKNFHTRGEPLNDFIKTTAYLDDFFNDGLIHFSISVERNTVHERDIGIDKYIKEKEDNNQNKIFDYQNYIT